jgi:PKD repeat protein
LAYGYTLAGGTLNFGINNATNFGSLSMSGSVTLGGTVSANLNSLYGLGGGSSFAVVNYNSKSGTFNNLILPSNFGWTNSYSGSAFSLVIASTPSLNVTNFGAIGDAVQCYVNTTSNSALVTTTNLLSAANIGESIEIFGAGTSTSPTNNQDLITVITNVLNATNIYVQQRCQATLTNTFATYGHNNTPNIQAAVNAVGAADTNDVINVPAGAYLLLPTNHYTIYGNSSILLQRGGINFVGAGTNSTTLLDQGAWTLINNNATRGFLIELVAPMNNCSAITFSYLTMDGGVQRGNTASHGFPANNVTGNGWDETHSALLSWMVNVSPTNFPNLYFTNDVVQHWRGEEFKSIDQPANCRIGIYGCTFSDGDATALNVYPAWDVESNVFINLFQVAEYYQQYYSYPAYFANNIITNITGNGFAINGGSGTNQPLTIASNIFNFSASGNNGIEFLPGDNVSVVGNQFFNLSGQGQTVINITAEGYQGTFCNSNILISDNSFHAGSYLIAIGNPAPDNAVNVTVCSNSWLSLTGTPYACITYGLASGVHFYANNISTNTPCQWSTGIDASHNRVGQFVLVDSNNIYMPISFSTYAPAITANSTNVISYSAGPNHVTPNVPSGVVFVLEDSSSNQIPPGAFLSFDNSQSTANGYLVYFSQSLATGYQYVGPKQHATFYWNSTNNTWYVPPIQFTAFPTAGTPPLTVNFNAPGVDSLGNAITHWTWNFGDGSFSTLGGGQNPVHVYRRPGIFTPTLVATNALGAAVTAVGPRITVQNPPLSLVTTSTNLTVAWPTSASDNGSLIKSLFGISNNTNNSNVYTLESTTSLTPPVIWTPVSVTPLLVNGQNVVSIPKTGPQMFFTLDGSPSLAAAYSQGTLSMQWPVGAINYQLESTTSLMPPIIWTPVLATPTVTNGWNIVSVSVNGPQMFFSLFQ